MEENRGQVATQSQQTEQFQCTGDCLRCSKEQRAYCACQHTYNSMRVMERLAQRMTVIEDHFREVKEMVEAIRDNEAMVFDPSEAAEIRQTLKEETQAIKPLNTL